MIRSFLKNRLNYIILLFLMIAVSFAALYPVVTNKYVLITVLLFIFICTIIIFLYVLEVYVKPLEHISSTLDKLLSGNYNARVQRPAKGILWEISAKLNKLTRNMNELTIQEQIQAEQLSTVIENTESGLVLIDEKGYIHFVNRKFLSLFGKTAKDYVGYLYYNVLTQEKIDKTVQETLLLEERVKELLVFYKEDTTKIFLELVCAPIFNEKGLLKGIVLVIYDISEFKQLEIMRKDFVANVSHELKTPITSIRGFSETLLDDPNIDETMREKFLHIIYNESKRIQSLIEDLLILSTIEKDNPHIIMSNFSMDSLVKELLPVLKQQAKQKNITFSLRMDKKISLVADENKIKQVLLNLFTNAINYTHENGTVTLHITETSKQAIIEVKDTGIGMAKEDIQRIFERFYRINKDRSRETGGTGLGLAIVKHIIEAHNGTIKVDSILHEGTTFSIYLPKNNSVN